MQESLEMCWNSNLTNSRRPSFGDDINVAYHHNQCLGI